VYGGTAIVGSETGDVDARTQTLVIEGNIESLIEALHSRGINDEEIGHLKSALQADAAAPQLANKPAVKSWIGNAAKKLASATGDLTLDVAKASLTALINSYLGLPPQ